MVDARTQALRQLWVGTMLTEIFADWDRPDSPPEYLVVLFHGKLWEEACKRIPVEATGEMG